MNLPTIIVCTAAVRDVLNAIFAPGGQIAMTVPLCAKDPEATWETPPTHWLCSHMGADSADVPEWQAMATGEGLLPSLPLGYEWGAGNLPSEEDAQAAIGAGNLAVYSRAGDETMIPLLDAVMEGEGLQRIPDAPA